MHDSVPQRLVAAATSGAVPEEAEHRGAPRVAVLIRAAKLITEPGEFLCVVRDASETGISVRLFHWLPPLEDAMLEMPNGDQHRLETVWLEDEKAGFRFKDKVNFERFIENKGEYSKRAMRLNIQRDAGLWLLGREVPVAIQNISQQGAQVLTSERLALDQRVKLECEGMPEIEAKVRWRKQGSYGLVFENTFQLADMARIVARMQLGGAA